MSMLDQIRKKAKPKLRFQVKWNKNGVIQWPTVKEKAPTTPAPVEAMYTQMTFHPAHVAGETCPHCEGKARRYHGVKGVWEGCHRCNRVGVLSEKDIALFERRLDQGLPISLWYPTTVARGNMQAA